MRQLRAFLIGVLLAVAGSAAAQSITRGTFDFTVFGERWRSGCAAPGLYGATVTRVEIEQYVSCVQTRSREDAQWAHDQVLREARREIEETGRRLGRP